MSQEVALQKPSIPTRVVGKPAGRVRPLADFYNSKEPVPTEQRLCRRRQRAQQAGGKPQRGDANQGELDVDSGVLDPLRLAP